MATLIVIIVIIGALGYGLERNRSRQFQPRSWLAGSVDVQDRDAERTLAELRSRGRPVIEPH